MSKYFILIIVASIFISCKITDLQKKYSISATYNTYSGGAGNGKGIIFRLQIFAKDNSLFSVESFYINSKKIPFQTRAIQNGLDLEANYFVPFPPTTLQNNSSKEITDEIITKNKFNPSWIVINANGKHFKINDIIYKSTIVQIAP